MSARSDEWGDRLVLAVVVVTLALLALGVVA